MGLTGFVIIHVLIASFSPAQGEHNQIVNAKFTRPVNAMPMSNPKIENVPPCRLPLELQQYRVKPELASLRNFNTTQRDRETSEQVLRNLPSLALSLSLLPSFHGDYANTLSSHRGGILSLI